MADEPTHWELSRRLDKQEKRLEQGLESIYSKLDELPNEKTLLALLATRDANQRALADDVRALERSLTEERVAREKAIAAEAASRKDADDAAERRIQTARNFALTALVGGVTVLLGILGFVSQVGGAA